MAKRCYASTGMKMVNVDSHVALLFLCFTSLAWTVLINRGPAALRYRKDPKRGTCPGPIDLLVPFRPSSQTSHRITGDPELFLEKMESIVKSNDAFDQGRRQPEAITK